MRRPEEPLPAPAASLFMGVMYPLISLMQILEKVIGSLVQVEILIIYIPIPHYNTLSAQLTPDPQVRPQF
jgi:hypothetical protein